MKTTIPILVLCCWFPAVHAFQLWGVDVTNSGRDQVRQAVKNVGVILISEAGQDQFFDSYDSSSVLEGSSRLYLGFVKENRHFAFAEYEFPGVQQAAMLQRLVEKYGPFQRKPGKFLSDSVLNWELSGVRITLQMDWENYRTQLIYAVPQALDQLRAEIQVHRSKQVQQKENEQLKFY